MINYKIILFHENKKSITFYAGKYISILEALEDNNINSEFQCRSGFCGVCRMILIDGNVRYNNNIIGHIHSNELYICSCQPMTNITINIGKI
uniref:Class I ribonucleotide reductase maintenance protein YfaE n=1 Tax=Candidatus Aschnera chinzeii TaxID=1485666 RepID=A0AAT9G4J9_9ENTR|nr:MAG: class I ribonucleotide reductase maintenance protein YfaE [Candidatus Aschnera chinzeii]